MAIEDRGFASMDRQKQREIASKKAVEWPMKRALLTSGPGKRLGQRAARAASPAIASASNSRRKRKQKATADNFFVHRSGSVPVQSRNGESYVSPLDH